jgi:hypothetical protein
VVAAVDGSEMTQAHLTVIRSLPCCLARVEGAGPCCGPVEAHHAKHERAGAKLKSPDATALPLCLRHHNDFHQLSGYFKGWRREQLRDWQRRQSERRVEAAF